MASQTIRREADPPTGDGRDTLPGTPTPGAAGVGVAVPATTWTAEQAEGGSSVEDPKPRLDPLPHALLESKLRLPRQSARLVNRPRLAALLDRGLETPLTLISSPAGYGKSTLLGAWLRSRPRSGPVAWVSLDERDRDASSFWAYVLLAAERAVPGTAAQAISELATGRVPIETSLAAFLNELSVLPDELTLVLDDYHLCDGPGVQPGMAFLLDHLPPQAHVIISTRADPALPLARLRARGQLVELRADDLRFTAAETASYLNDVNALELDSSDVSALSTRTEGWVAALQLAALSLRGRSDSARFVAEFAGDDRFVLDYLADEVLNRLTVETRRFLLETSILDRLTGSLCDAVTGVPGSRAKLEFLERQNLFLVPLDEQRRWYRYHHLFADVLNSHLLDELATEVALLHRRASDWYDLQGDPEPAVRHALAASDIDRAAELVELAIPELRRQRREATIRRWAAELPPDAVKNRPVLALGFVGALMASNDFSDVGKRLDEVEMLVQAQREDLVVVDHAELTRSPAAIETYRAALALVAGDLPGTMAHAQQAIERAANEDPLSIAAASALAGLASWTQGDLLAAHHGYSIAVDQLSRAGHVADVLGCTIALADIETSQGRLRDAETTVQRALTLAAQSGEADRLRGTPDMHVALSALALEHGDLRRAAEHLRRADELGDPAGLPQNAYRWRVAMARLRQAEGDPSGALALLDEAGRVYVGDFSPDVRPIAATRARLLASSGRVAEALAWAHDRAVTAADELSYLREYEHVTLARLLLAAHAAAGGPSLTEAVHLLERLSSAAEAAGRVGSLVEVLVLHALASQAAGRDQVALASLERAVRYAEPEGYCRVFTSEGTPMRALLTTLCRRNPDWAYPWRLRAAMMDETAHPDTAAVFNRSGGFHESVAGAAGSEPTTPPAPIEPLSSRELEILRYLGSELDGPAIARELSVSLSTVRTHTQHVYAKLGVNNRRAAVRRAHQLGLFARRASR